VDFIENDIILKFTSSRFYKRKYIWSD